MCMCVHRECSAEQIYYKKQDKSADINVVGFTAEKFHSYVCPVHGAH